MDRHGHPPDGPREPPGERPRPWSAEDVRRRLENLPASHPSSPHQRRDTSGRSADKPPTAPESPWYQRHLDRADPPDAWGRFRLDLAERVPERGGDRKVRGLIHIPDRGIREQRSGKDGPSDGLDMPGKTKRNEHHVEAHTAAVMRRTGADHAVLYINQDPCYERPDSCRNVLPQLLPERAVLVVYAPARRYIFTGLPDPSSAP